ncbi:hypothetical protein MTO96_011588 [Rhipicephalus appendiculatus]
MIHNGGLIDADRFTNLGAVLTGDAALAIAGLPATASCYCEALDILKQRYAKPDVIIQSHMQQLIEMQTVRSANDLRGLRCLYDRVQSQTRSLKTFRVSEDNYSAMLYPIFLKSLPYAPRCEPKPLLREAGDDEDDRPPACLERQPGSRKDVESVAKHSPQRSLQRGFVGGANRNRETKAGRGPVAAW